MAHHDARGHDAHQAVAPGEGLGENQSQAVKALVAGGRPGGGKPGDRAREGPGEAPGQQDPGGGQGHHPNRRHPASRG